MSELKSRVSPSEAPGEAPGPVMVPSFLLRAEAHHILLAFLGLGLVIWLLSGFYMVNTGEVAVVARLGSFERTGDTLDKTSPVLLMEPGLHYRLPYPIDVTYTVPMQQTQTLEINDFDSSPTAYEEMKKAYLRHGYSKQVIDAIFDPYLITGDKNLIHGSLDLTYHVVDPEAYLTCVDDAPGEHINRDNVIRQVANHVLIQEIAKRGVDFILTVGVSEMQQSILVNSQAQMDRIGLGIKIDQILMTPPKPPAAVAWAFNEVLQAQQDRERKILDAQTQAQSAVTKAQAEAQSTLFSAQTTEQQEISEAQGDASQFAAVYAKYKVAPDVTKADLFYDTMNSVLNGLTRLIWVKPGEETTVILDAPKPRQPEDVSSGQSP